MMKLLKLLQIEQKLGHRIEEPFRIDQLSKKMRELIMVAPIEYFHGWFSPDFIATRAIYCLQRAGIECLSDLVTRTQRDLLKIHNLGKVTAVEIMNGLERHGLSLAQDRDRPLRLPPISLMSAVELRQHIIHCQRELWRRGIKSP